MASSEEYHRKAAEAREQARRSKDPLEVRVLSRMAAQWERLAQHKTKKELHRSASDSLSARLPARARWARTRMLNRIDDWEVISKQRKEPSPSVFQKLCHIFTRRTEREEPFILTIRQRSTGNVRRLTAYSDQEAQLKITNELFDGRAQ